MIKPQKGGQTYNSDIILSEDENALLSMHISIYCTTKQGAVERQKKTCFHQFSAAEFLDE